jgi:hypothetical protein
MKFIIWFAVWHLLDSLVSWINFKRGKPYKEYQVGTELLAWVLDMMIFIAFYNYFIK